MHREIFPGVLLPKSTTLPWIWLPSVTFSCMNLIQRGLSSISEKVSRHLTVIKSWAIPLWIALLMTRSCIKIPLLGHNNQLCNPMLLRQKDGGEAISVIHQDSHYPVSAGGPYLLWASQIWTSCFAYSLSRGSFKMFSASLTKILLSPLLLNCRVANLSPVS